MTFLRRRPLPDAVRLVRLPPGERRAAWAVTDAGAPVVATDGALLLPDGTRLAWEQVERATWAAPVLTLLQVAEVEGAGPRTALHLADPGDLPEIVRDRVTSSVAWSRHERLAPRSGVRLVGRRRAGEQLLAWQLVYDRGTDPSDPLVREQAERLLEATRRSVG